MTAYLNELYWGFKTSKANYHLDTFLPHSSRGTPMFLAFDDRNHEIVSSHTLSLTYLTIEECIGRNCARIGTRVLLSLRRSVRYRCGGHILFHFEFYNEVFRVGDDLQQQKSMTIITVTNYQESNRCESISNLYSSIRRNEYTTSSRYETLLTIPTSVETPVNFILHSLKQHCLQLIVPQNVQFF